MRTFLFAALFAAGVGLTWADDPKKADDKKTEDKATETVKDKLDALRKGLNTEMQAWSKEYSKAEPAERAKLMPKRMEILQAHGKKALTLAKENLKDEAALDIVTMALMYGSPKTQGDAGELVVANFADDPKVAKMLPQIADMDAGPKLLEALAEKSKSKDIRGIAKYALVEAEIENTDYPRGGKPLPAKEAAEKITQAEKKLDALVAEYGDVKVAQGRGEAEIKKAAEKLKFFANNLVIGKVMPDVETESLDGKKVKVSDLRGKVVVLDIWATWCGPCVAMIPHEKKMVEERKDKKFALISVSADDKKETLEKFLETKEMPWTHWWDGRGGPLTSKLQVKFYPTIYVLDAKGVIRYKHVRGEKMDEAVDALLKEMESGAGGQ